MNIEIVFILSVLVLAILGLLSKSIYDGNKYLNKILRELEEKKKRYSGNTVDR